MRASSVSVERSEPTLKRSLRLRDLTLFYVVTILSIRWIAAAAAQGPGMLVVWLLGLVGLFVPLAASVLALAARYPGEGGLYVWTRESFGERSAFLAAWTYWMSNLPFFPSILYFGAGSLIVAFGRHGARLAASPSWYMGFAVFWLVVIMALNVRGLAAGKWLNNVCSIGGWLPILILVLLAAVSAARFGSATHFTAAAMRPHLSPGNAAVWASLFFSYAGCEAASFMGDEIENSRRILPRALLTAGAVIAIAYIAGSAALLVALPGAASSGVDDLLRDFAQVCAHVGIGWLVPVLAVLVSLSAVGGAAGFLTATSRLPFVAGIDRYLPAVFGKVHPRYRTPWVAVLVYGSTGILIAILGQAGTSVRGAYDVMVSMAVITLFLPYLFLFAALIRLAREPAMRACLPLPGGPPVAILLAAVGFASTLFTIGLVAIPGPAEANKEFAVGKLVVTTLSVLGLGLVVFALGRRRVPSRVDPHVPHR